VDQRRSWIGPHFYSRRTLLPAWGSLCSRSNENLPHVRLGIFDLPPNCMSDTILAYIVSLGIIGAGVVWDCRRYELGALHSGRCRFDCGWGNQLGALQAPLSVKDLFNTTVEARRCFLSGSMGVALEVDASATRELAKIRRSGGDSSGVESIIRAQKSLSFPRPVRGFRFSGEGQPDLKQRRR
jgi:hypothetical protein